MSYKRDFFFITGTSSGIGAAFAEELSMEHDVTGVARRNVLFKGNYTHLCADLSIPGQVHNLPLVLPEDCNRAVLINNAGIIGDIKRVGDFSNENIERVIQVNLTALIEITNRFIGQARIKKYPCLILNISSGAAVRPIPSWSLYCAAKSAVDAFTTVVNEELIEAGNDHIHAYSIYPGVVDTAMQQAIRDSDPNDFSSKIRFDNFKTEGTLLQPALVARKILAIFSAPERPTSTVVALKDY